MWKKGKGGDMGTMSFSLSNPKAVAEAGERIYGEMYRQAFEKEHLGKFVAIDVTTNNAFIGDTAEKALEVAREKAPHGTFHLILVGSAGAFRVGFSNASADWLFQ
jgi:hypothetical protein